MTAPRHPYATAPARAFWSRAVSRDLEPLDFVRFDAPLIGRDERVMTAGSCFAANLVPYLEREGFEYVRTEYTHPIFRSTPPENLSYGKFSAGYGNLYTTRQLLQLARRATGEFKPRQDRERVGDEIIDMFRPGLRYRARSDREFDLLRDQHLDATLRAFKAADVFIFTLGLTEAWISAEDGAVYPACPGTIAGTFDPERHVFKNFTAKEIADDFCEFLAILRGVNPDVRVILTVSPVPLVATATDQHVLLATIYSKSALRVAAEEIVSRSTGVSYFPAYEIITGPQAPHDYFEADRRNPSRKGIDMVMRVFLNACGVAQAPLVEAQADQAPAPVQAPVAARPTPPEREFGLAKLYDIDAPSMTLGARLGRAVRRMLSQDDEATPRPPPVAAAPPATTAPPPPPRSEAAATGSASALSKMLVDFECEEAMTDRKA